MSLLGIDFPDDGMLEYSGVWNLHCKPQPVGCDGANTGQSHSSLFFSILVADYAVLSVHLSHEPTAAGNHLDI